MKQVLSNTAIHNMSLAGVISTIGNKEPVLTRICEVGRLCLLIFFCAGNAYYFSLPEMPIFFYAGNVIIIPFLTKEENAYFIKYKSRTQY